MVQKYPIPESESVNPDCIFSHLSLSCLYMSLVNLTNPNRTPSGSLSLPLSRLNREEGDGAWCPQGQLEPTDSQYLQVGVLNGLRSAHSSWTLFLCGFERKKTPLIGCHCTGEF